MHLYQIPHCGAVVVVAVVAWDVEVCVVVIVRGFPYIGVLFYEQSVACPSFQQLYRPR